MNCFTDLQKSNEFHDRMTHYFLTNLLDLLFGSHDTIHVDATCENESNHKLVHNQWEIIDAYFHVPTRIKHTQKCVRQTLKHIIDTLNSKYQFKQPIIFNPIKKNVWQNNTCVSLCYSKVEFV